MFTTAFNAQLQFNCSVTLHNDCTKARNEALWPENKTNNTVTCKPILLFVI